MERTDVMVERRVIRSVVTVVEVGGRNYCSGFVAQVDARHTYIVTQSYFVMGQEKRLRGRFCDKVKKEALVVGKVHGSLCLLRTDPHTGCQAVRVSNDDIQLEQTLVFPPSSPTTYFRIMSFCHCTISYSIWPTHRRGYCRYYGSVLVNLPLWIMHF